MGFDVLYLPPIHPIGVTERKGRDNTLGAGDGRPGQPLGHRQRGRRPYRHRQHSGHLRRFFPPPGNGTGVPSRGGSRLRPAVLAGPPLGQRAPGVVPPPSRWLDRLRRESAQEIPGHLSDQFLAGPGKGSSRTLECLQGDPRFLDRQRGDRFPGRQSPHQAGGLLGMVDPGGAGRASRRHFPGRGLHQAPHDGEAGRGRIQPGLHLFHLAHRAARPRRAASVPGGADRGKGRFHAAQLLAQHARHPFGPVA